MQQGKTKDRHKRWRLRHIQSWGVREIFVHNILFTLILCGFLLNSCTTAPPQQKTKATPVQSILSKEIPTPIVTHAPPTPTPHPVPQHYTKRILFQGTNRPDDLVFDRKGQLLFSNPHDGTIDRLNNDGTTTVLLSGLDKPEGLVVLSNGTLVIAEQGPNRIITLAPGASVTRVLRQLPGVVSTAACKDGVDGIAFDATTNTLIVPDSPIGNVYRLSLDGKTLTLLAGGIVRPVGSAVDAQGNIYVADECGGALWRLTKGDQRTRLGHFGMPDDVVIDDNGNILVTDLNPVIHALIRLNPTTGSQEILAQKGYIEPQGLVLDERNNIFVADDFADTIVEYIPN